MSLLVVFQWHFLQVFVKIYRHVFLNFYKIYFHKDGNLNVKEMTFIRLSVKVVGVHVIKLPECFFTWQHCVINFCQICYILLVV